MAHKARRPYAFMGLFVAGLLASTSAVSAANVTYDRLVNPEDQNWLTNNRTYDGHRYSPLDEINTGNVGDLKLAFAIPLIPRMPAGLGGSLQGTPLVDDGTMYMTDGAGAVYSIDVTSGTRGYINWIMDPDTDPEIPGIQNNRGVALLGDTVYSVTRDGYLTATDAATGEMLWQAATQHDPDEYFTMAPLAIDGKIIMGPAGDAPMRGWLEARSAEDGSQLWQFWSIPGPGEPGHETWPDTDIYLEGASSFWVTGTYDPDLEPAVSTACPTRRRSAIRRCVRATTSTARARSPSTATPVSWSGTSSTRRTSSGTMTRSARRCWSTPTVRSGSSTSAATASSTPWMPPTATS